MSEPAYENGQVEQRSKVKLVRNAKGDPQWEISVLVGEDEGAVAEAKRIAVAMHRTLEQELIRS